MRQVLFFLLALLTTPLHADPLFSGFTAEYEVSRNGTFLGTNKRRLDVREEGRLLDYASTTTPEGLVALFVSDQFMEHSLIRVTPEGLRPLRYDYQQTGGKKQVTFQARFDWQKKRIRLSSRDGTLPLLPHTQDLLSFQLALMRGLSRGQRQFSFQIVDHKRIRLHTLEYIKTEQTPSSLGPLEILQLQQKADKASYRFSFWCARQLDYLPVRIDKTEDDGDVISLQLRRYKQSPFHLGNQDPLADDDF